MPKESAVEILIFKPNGDIAPDLRGVHENLWIKQRFKQYVSIGVYLDGEDLKYYFFKDCDNTPKIYSSLTELKQALPNGLENIFENTPKLFIMGHGHGGRYGLGNIHGPSEEICNENFDKIITDFEKALPMQPDNIVVTLEACNTDNRALAREEGHQKTFLERLSANHRNITFCGTGPWDSKDVETGYRASGGFPILNAPITATGGGIWKHGNSVIFYHGFYQVVVIKSMFASTKTAKELKINTIEYACAVLKKTSLDRRAQEEMITKICSSRNVLKIEDLKNVSDFPQDKFEDHEISKLMIDENKILEKENNNYLARVQEILARSESGEKFKKRDLLIIALGLKDLSIFKGHEDMLVKILANKALLSLVMVTCGKVLIAGTSNDAIIALLLKNGIDINSVDENGMTALHYAVQNFYNYRNEPLNLINKLIACGADLEAKDNDNRTPLQLATEHSIKKTVIASCYLLLLLERKLAGAALGNAYTMRPLISTHLDFSKKVDESIIEHRHDDARMQLEYDKSFGLMVLKK